MGFQQHLTAPVRNRLFAPIVAACLLLALLIAGGVLAFVFSQSAGSDPPAEVSAFKKPPTSQPAAVFDVREANGTSLTILPANIDGEALTIELADGVTLEGFVAGRPADIEPGTSLTFIGEPDPVRNFVIRQVIAIREPVTSQADGLPQSAGGFTGAELLINPNHRIILWGPVESITFFPDANRTEVSLAGPDGPILVQIYSGIPLFFIEAYDSPIADGDRFAFHAPAGASPARAQAILIAPQGAR
ncbi:MAG TPA: hypothetical protein DGL25_00660 [Dehalococcoidia bacterium]|nr:hypothetical protein [Dehalococcoidia bacterium]